MKRILPVVLLSAVVAAAGTIYWQYFRTGRSSSDSKPSSERTLNIRSDLSAGNSPRVRVNLTGGDVERVRLAVDGPYVVRPVDDERILGRGAKLEETDVRATSIGLRVGTEEYRSSRIEIVPEASPSVWLNGHKYRGTIRLFRRPGNEVLAVNAVPLEDYIASVVDSEMPAAFPDEARKAQAVVSRTYAIYQMNAVSSQSLFDVYASTRSQKYLGTEYRDGDGRRLAGESVNSRQMTSDTAGSVCTWQGRLFCTYYSAVCGGETTPGIEVFTDAAEPLKSVECTWCEPSEHYRWTTRVSRNEANTALKKYFSDTGKPFGKLAAIRPAKSKTPAIPFFEVSDGRNRQSISSIALVRALPPSTLPSPRFEISTDKNDLVFEGRGHGHGVGLCQWGARGLAAAGRSWLEILEHYYPGSQVVVIDTGSQ